MRSHTFQNFAKFSKGWDSYLLHFANTTTKVDLGSRLTGFSKKFISFFYRNVCEKHTA